MNETYEKQFMVYRWVGGFPIKVACEMTYTPESGEDPKEKWFHVLSPPGTPKAAVDEVIAQMDENIVGWEEWCDQGGEPE